MGWSWALYFCQALMEDAALVASGPPTFAPGPALTTSRSSPTLTSIKMLSHPAVASQAAGGSHAAAAGARGRQSRKDVMARRQALARELREEWGPEATQLRIGSVLGVTRHTYPAPGPDVLLIFFEVHAPREDAWRRGG